MHGIQPQALTDEEFLRMAYIQGVMNLPPAWLEELLTRYERTLMEKDVLTAQVEDIA